MCDTVCVLGCPRVYLGQVKNMDANWSSCWNLTFQYVYVYKHRHKDDILFNIKVLMNGFVT